MTRQWYIDAWSVIDGYAFASLRSPDSLDALATFFVSPPYFEPEPVASLATALAATRGQFQEGYRLGGDEVAFDSPDQVVEAVRRAYRAGGLDMNGGPTPAAPEPRVEPPGAIHPEELVDDRISVVWNDLRTWLHEPSDAWPRRNVEQKLADLIEVTFPRLVPKFVGSSVVEQLARLMRDAGDRSRSARELAGWIDRARGIGIDVQLGAELVVAVRGTTEGFGWEAPELRDMSPVLLESLIPILYRTSGALLTEFQVPFVVPMPLLFQNREARDYPAIPTLGHLLAVVSSDPRYLAQIESVVAFIPVIVAALIQLPARSLPHQGFPPVPGSRELHEQSAAAARWLLTALPSNRLRGHPVEGTIHRLVLRLLGGANEDRNAMAAAGNH